MFQSLIPLRHLLHLTEAIILLVIDIHQWHHQVEHQINLQGTSFYHIMDLRQLWLLYHLLHGFLKLLLRLHLSRRLHLTILEFPFSLLKFLLLGLQQGKRRNRLHHQFRGYLLHLPMQIVHTLHALNLLQIRLLDHPVVVCGQCKLGCALVWLCILFSHWCQSWPGKLQLVHL